MSEENKPKNVTYQRALSAFFGDQELTADQKQSLPQDVDGLSAKRQSMIKSVLEAPNASEELSALKLLRSRFGIPQDIRVITLALTLEDESLAVEGLKTLERWIESQQITSGEALESWRDELTTRIERLTLRSFRDDVQQHATRCLRSLASS